MAYYMKKEKKEEKKPENPHDTREKRFFWQLVGCVIVLLIFLVIWVVREH